MLERGDVKNIVGPRLEGDIDINSVWKALEVAMVCVFKVGSLQYTLRKEIKGSCCVGGI